MTMRGFFAIISACFLLGACEDINSADYKEREATKKMAAEAAMQVGMPGIVNFQEKRTLRMLYELRDNPAFRTYTYVRDLNGQLHKLCDSTGYGIPYATQFSNPQRVVYGDHGSVTLPQAEPNGLFMPSTAEATWVMCQDPGDKKVKPVYVEDRITSSPFPLLPEPAKQANAQ
jgi:hypothetical protein